MKIARDIPRSIQNTMDDITLARRYNNVTGASVSHKEIGTMGFIESLELELAIEMITGN
jgi:hypothetical protein